MNSLRLRRRSVGSFIAALLAAIGLVPVSTALASPPPRFNPPKGVYLATGDSLTFGYQEAKVIAGLPDPNPATFDTGFVNDFASAMGTIRPAQQVIDLGCPGATSSDVVSTVGCPSYPFSLHVNYPTETQLAAALNVLRADRGQVSPITVGIGANDLLHLVSGCDNGVSCIEAGFLGVEHQVVENLDAVLDALSEAAPYSEIIVLGVYNPNVLLFSADPMVEQFNNALAAAAAGHRARFADPFPAINGAIPGNELESVCTYTAVCGPLQDVHPTDAGYARIANGVFAVSDYSKLAMGTR